MAYGRFRRKAGVKYNNTKITIDNLTFDSRKEANRYCELRLLERAGTIKNLELQKRYELIPAQYEPDTITTTKTGKEKIVKGKCIERAVYYVSDFTYIDTVTGEIVVEDTKGFRTTEYVLKRKMFLYKYGFPITEI